MAPNQNLSRLFFVSTELHPETPGGAGVLIGALATELVDLRPVTLLLCTPTLPDLQNRPGVVVEHVPIPETGFSARSEAVAQALAGRIQPGDRVEIQDFEGVAFHSLVHRAKLGLERTLLTVRFHGPYDLLREAMVAKPDDWGIPAVMEQEAFRMADLVLVPVAGHAETLVSRYQIDKQRIVIAPPPITDLTTIDMCRDHKAVFAVIGRLGEMKGSQDMVAAALQLLLNGFDLEVRFIGGDGWSSAAGMSMRQWLESMIPAPLAGAFSFVGPVAHERLSEHLADVTAVVVPSRFESFCLAAHEARRAGLPVIVPDLTAFSGVFSEASGALIYDRTVEDLAATMERLLSEPGLEAHLREAPPPSVGNPVSPYLEDSEPRHPRSQAGLATAAMKRFDQVQQRAASAKRPSLLQGIYRLMPESVAEMLRRAPQGLKDRAKRHASWYDELARRHHEELERSIRERLTAVDARIAAGDFPEIGDPDATIVIPVHNDIRYLDETLASIYEQSHDSWEVVVVDDGSTDPKAIGYLDTLDRPRVKVIRQANTGLPGARNAGMDAARARYVVPLDSDDQLEPEFLAQMIAALDPHPEAAYAHCYARLHHDIDAVWVTRPFNPYWQLLGNGVVGCVLMRREAWEQVGGYDETMTSGNEDWELWLRLMEARWGQVQVPRALFRYRKHGISMSVETESRFEEGRRMVRDRHPGLYDPARVARLKARWYPLVTAVSEIDQRPDAEIEVISDFGRLEATWGKSVVDVRGLSPFPTDLVMELATALETNPAAGRAVTDGLPPVVMVRRWTLHDPGGAPHEVVVIDARATGPEVEMPTHVPRPGWSVPDELREGDLPIQRQPPEEAGGMPDIERW